MLTLFDSFNQLTARVQQLETAQKSSDALIADNTAAITNLQETLAGLNQSILNLAEAQTTMADTSIKSMELFNTELEKLKAIVTEMAQRDQKVSIPDMLKYGKEPWFNLIGGEYDASRGMSLNMDWNTAFVHQLKLQGYSGINEFQIVASWLANLAATQQSKLGAE